jgi:hypothetical protein
MQRADYLVALPYEYCRSLGVALAVPSRLALHCRISIPVSKLSCPSAWPQTCILEGSLGARPLHCIDFGGINLRSEGSSAFVNDGGVLLVLE